MKNKTIFITLDYEEWFHITYLDKYNFSREEIGTVADKILPFFEKLSSQGIFITVFVVGEIIDENVEILKKIKGLGHEIACHSQSHTILTELSEEDFLEETKRNKNNLEKILETTIYGYRAPSFSLDNKKLSLLKDIGFKYDSSYISFKENEYSQILDLTGYKKITSNIYFDDGFYEFELPYATILNKKKPLSGGYFRLYPLWFFQKLVLEYLKNNDSLIFFIHPYEIYGGDFPMNNKLNIKDKIRLNLNRKATTKKLFKFINFARKKGYSFSTLKDKIEEFNKL